MRHAAGPRDEPDVTTKGEADLGGTDRRLTEEQGRALRAEQRSRAAHQDRGEQSDAWTPTKHVPGPREGTRICAGAKSDAR